MTKADLLSILPGVVQTLFVFAYGACVGSLTNVLVYRLPLGLDVVAPASRCPACQTKLTWRENIPILGWLLLRGKCRFCKVKISPEYPLVELFVACLFTFVFVSWYVVPEDTWLGMLRPEWATNGLGSTWPTLIVLAILLGSLTAITLIDSRTYTIPLVLTFVPALVALIIHPLHALWFSHRMGDLAMLRPGVWAGDAGRWITAPGEVWTIATPGLWGWPTVGAGILGGVGLLISIGLLRVGLIRQSFADYEAWEAEHLASQDADGAPSAPVTGGVIPPESAEPPAAAGDTPVDLWIQYPHTRREMIKEVAFIAFPFIGMVLGWMFTPGILTSIAGPYEVVDPATSVIAPPVDVPLWLNALAAVCLGYLVGGGVAWAVRVFGSLAFGKEAMGLGDVHLMATVGACLGWIDPTIAFFAAAFLAIPWAVLGRIAGGSVFKRALPYGPFLAAATVLVITAKPGFEWILSSIMSGLGPVNLP